MCLYMFMQYPWRPEEDSMSQELELELGLSITV